MTTATAPATGETSAPSTVLGVEALEVDLGGRRILDGVSFTVDAGGFCGLIGSNGAGKTTLLRAILGLVKPTAGTVTIAGRPRDRRNPQIGYVPQKIALDPDLPLRARDLVGLGMDGHRFGLPWPSSDRRRRVDEMLAAVDATSLADTRVGELSGGQQQRVMIALALVSGPRLLLLDEALANLDLRAAREVVDLLASISAEQQIAVLLSAHDINPLLAVMDRVVYLAEGRAVSGTTDEVVRSDTLSALYRQPVEVVRVGGRVIVAAGSPLG